MTFFAIGQEETDEDLANFRKYAIVQLSPVLEPSCVIGPFDSVDAADDYMSPGSEYSVVEMIPPNPTKVRMMQRYYAEKPLYDSLAEND